MTYDVAIIGAGAAGLACGEALLRQGLRVVVLEGRNRIGGRVLSARFEGADFAAELGAEFVHGNPPELMRLLASQSLSFFDACDEHLFLRRGKLESVEFWDRLDGALAKLGRVSRDLPVAEFLGRLRESAETKALFRAFVEGFHSADLAVIGARGLAEAEESGDDTLNGSGLFRFAGPYHDLFTRHFLANPALREALRYQAVVKAVEWSGRELQVHGRGVGGASFCTSARRIVVTVPLGVLQAQEGADAAIAWRPALPGLKHNLAAVPMGHIQRMVFRFRSRFWENLARQKPLGFFHAGPEFFFPTWWTLMPLRVPCLVAWQGGPKAAELARWSREERARLALDTLAALTGRSGAFLRRELLGFMTHNWSRDPFTLGAYSYVGVNGGACARRLEWPVAGKVFFAGEGTVSGPARGTVHGALRSGERAARQVLRSLG